MAACGAASLQAVMASMSRSDPPGWAMACTPWRSAAFTVISDSGASLVIKSGDNTLHLDFRDKDTLEISGGPEAHKFVFKRVK
jgi:hypothetical protein